MSRRWRDERNATPAALSAVDALRTRTRVRLRSPPPSGLVQGSLYSPLFPLQPQRLPQSSVCNAKCWGYTDFGVVPLRDWHSRPSGLSGPEPGPELGPKTYPKHICAVLKQIVSSWVLAGAQAEGRKLHPEGLRACTPPRLFGGNRPFSPLIPRPFLFVFLPFSIRNFSVLFSEQRFALRKKLPS